MMDEASRNMKRDQSVENYCPHLGLADDAETRALFPSYCNYCQKVDPIELVALDHQRNFCLTEKYPTCPVFMQSTNTQLPHDMRAKSARLARTKRWIRKVALVLAILLLVSALVFLFLFLKRPLIPVSGSHEASEEMKSSEEFFYQETTQIVGVSTDRMLSPDLPSGTIQATALLEKLDLAQTRDRGETPSPPVSSTPVPFATPAPLLRGLEQPIGPVEKFIIHQVKIGESLGQYVSTYQSSAEAILRVNCTMPVPLWVDTYLVIPLNSDGTAGLICFDPYQVNTDSISAEELAITLDTDLNHLTYYNEIKQGEKLKSGEWLIIPRITPIQ